MLRGVGRNHGAGAEKDTNCGQRKWMRVLHGRGFESTEYRLQEQEKIAVRTSGSINHAAINPHTTDSPVHFQLVLPAPLRPLFLLVSKVCFFLPRREIHFQHLHQEQWLPQPRKQRTSRKPDLSVSFAGITIKNR